jgi:hypothetical protein
MSTHGSVTFKKDHGLIDNVGATEIPISWVGMMMRAIFAFFSFANFQRQMQWAQQQVRDQVVGLQMENAFNRGFILGGIVGFVLALLMVAVSRLH